MKCDNELCLFQRGDACTCQEEISINGYGRCDQCVLLSPPGEMLGMLKAACLFSFLNTTDEDVSKFVDDDLAAILKKKEVMEKEEKEEKEARTPKTKGKPQPKSKANAKAKAKGKKNSGKKSSESEKNKDGSNIIPFE